MISSRISSLVAVAAASFGFGAEPRGFFEHRKDTPLSKTPHSQEERPLSKRAKRRLRGKAKR